MSEATAEFMVSNAAIAEPWPLRLAQQAFAQALDDGHRRKSFRSSAVRQAASASLSALSEDDRGLLVRWLSLQLGSARARMMSSALAALTAIDASLAAAVSSRLPLVRASLADHPARASAAA